MQKMSQCHRKQPSCEFGEHVYIHNDISQNFPKRPRLNQNKVTFGVGDNQIKAEYAEYAEKLNQSMLCM